MARIYRITPTGFTLLASYRLESENGYAIIENDFLHDAEDGTRFVVIYPDGTTDIYTVQTRRVLV